MTMTGE